MRVQFLACLAVGGAMIATSVLAEPYVDYTPQKGLWHVVTVKVEPSHVDDYVTGLRRTWAPSEEIAKKHGLIDSYQIMTKMNAEDGQGNVLLIEHIPNAALLEVDQARDQEMRKEFQAALPKPDRDKMLEDFGKYRVFVGDDYWNELVYAK
jgi:hypothetical protein